MGDLAVDDWEQLAEELVQETAGDQFGGIDNQFGGMRKAPSQVETKRICVWALSCVPVPYLVTINVADCCQQPACYLLP